ncbi:MAG TPA: histidine kinase [Aggregatilineales bacterium]|nr:sensor histidine kinase [Anaerolineales bacterium]HRE47062.1 histidine kinase [Aggregatilineales bacterium]
MNISALNNPKDALIAEVQGEYDQIQKRLKELTALIEQSQVEVRKLQQRAVDVTAQMTRLEANFETVPRNDIKVVYNTALDARARLLSVQSQLEKFQQDRSQLEHFSQLMGTLLKMLGAVRESDVRSLHTETADAPQGLDDETIVRIVQSQESERQRLARTMHDGPAQSLTNFILQAEICRRLFDRNPDRAVEELDNLKSAASLTFQRVRDFIFELRPMMLDDLGLIPTMRRYVDVFTEKSKIETRINIVGEERQRIEGHNEVLIFRGLQEMMNYARDLSGATRVEIMLDITANPVRAVITFNGKPLSETEATIEDGKNKAFGLKNLVDRIELVGGKVESDYDGETNRVEFALPTERATGY